MVVNGENGNVGVSIAEMTTVIMHLYEVPITSKHSCSDVHCRWWWQLWLLLALDGG